MNVHRFTVLFVITLVNKKMNIPFLEVSNFILINNRTGALHVSTHAFCHPCCQKITVNFLFKFFIIVPNMPRLQFELFSLYQCVHCRELIICIIILTCQVLFFFLFGHSEKNSAKVCLGAVLTPPSYWLYLFNRPGQTEKTWVFPSYAPKEQLDFTVETAAWCPEAAFSIWSLDVCNEHIPFLWQKEL